MKLELSRGVAITSVNIVLTSSVNVDKLLFGHKTDVTMLACVNRDLLADSFRSRPAGLSVPSECKEEVEASQRDVSLLLLLLQWRSQRGSLWLPRNHARYTEEIIKTCLLRRTVFIQFFTMNRKKMNTSGTLSFQLDMEGGQMEEQFEGRAYCCRPNSRLCFLIKMVSDFLQRLMMIYNTARIFVGNVITQLQK